MDAALIRPFVLTSIGKKYLMALTGLVWAGFVLSHALGNMLLFVGADAYNKYAHAIVNSPIILPAEAFLVLAFITHVGLAIRLTIENKKAKGRGYAVAAHGAKAVTWASRTMAVHGVLVLFFLISHIATFKFGTYYETTVDGVLMRDLYRLVVEVFHQPAFLGWYVVSLVLLGFHLSHGVGSIFQSLGLKNKKYEGAIKKISCAYSFLVAAGFLSQPIYIFFFVG